MNKPTLEKLEFDEIRETLAGFCGTSLSKRLARSLTPTADAHLIRLWLGQVRELVAVSAQHSLPPMGGVHDIRDGQLLQ